MEIPGESLKFRTRTVNAVHGLRRAARRRCSNNKTLLQSRSEVLCRRRARLRRLAGSGVRRVRGRSSGPIAIPSPLLLRLLTGWRGLSRRWRRWRCGRTLWLLLILSGRPARTLLINARASALLGGAAGSRRPLLMLPFRIVLSFVLGTRRPRRSGRPLLGRHHLDGGVNRRSVRIDLVWRKVFFFVEPGDRARLGADDALPFDQLHEPGRVLTATDDCRFDLADEAFAAAGRAPPEATEIGRDVKTGTAHGINRF